MRLGTHAVVAGLTLALSLGAYAPMAFADPAASLDEAAEQLETYGSELAALKDNLATKTSDLEMTSYHIGEKKAQIADTKVQLTEAKDVLSNRMRSSYKSGKSSLIQLFLGSSSIDDVVSRIYYMDKVAKSDADRIAKVRALEEQLNAEKDELEQIQASEQAAVDELQVQVDDYTEMLEEAQAYYDSLDAQIQQQIAEQQTAAENENLKVALDTVAPAEEPEVEQVASENEATTQDSASSTEEESSTQNSSSSSSGAAASGGGGLSTAYAAIGSPYEYGADGPSSFDCSGLVCYCYGYGRGRTTYDMIDSLQSDGSWKSSMSELSAGDLVFTGYGHVGIYLGNGTMIHAPTPGNTVCIQTVWSCIGGGSY